MNGSFNNIDPEVDTESECDPIHKAVKCRFNNIDPEVDTESEFPVNEITFAKKVSTISIQKWILKVTLEEWR